VRFLVTGVNGFIGSELKESLTNSGHEVVGISKTGTSGESLTYIGSITDEVFLKNLVTEVNNVDVVIHLAAAKEASIKSRLFETNVYGTELILRTATELRSKQFVLISGVSIYNSGGSEVITEESLPCPKGPYLLTKYLSEQVLVHDRDFSGSKKLIRIPSPVGPKLNSNKIFKKFVESAMLNLNLEVWGDGNRLQNYLDLRDFSDALELLIAHPGQGIWNIAGPREISDKSLANTIIRTTNSSSKIKILNNTLSSQISMPKISTAKIQTDVGMKFVRSIEDTILWVSKGVTK